MNMKSGILNPGREQILFSITSFRCKKHKEEIYFYAESSIGLFNQYTYISLP